MIGQSKLINQFNNFSLDNLPHTILLVGKYGCGKHTLCTELANRLQLDLFEVPDKITVEVLNQINSFVNPTLCVFKDVDFKIKEGNMLLKTLEEPLSHIFYIILSENTEGILDTILNRCQIFRFTDYTWDELVQFATEQQIPGFQTILPIADTPGKLLNWYKLPITDMLNLSEQIFDNIEKANLANILVLSDKLNFDGKNDSKFDPTVFFNVLLYCIRERVMKNLQNSVSQYLITKEFLYEITFPGMNLKYAYENYLYKLKGKVML